MAVNKNFIVKNGIEVNNNLIYSDTELNSVGIGTTIVQHKLHVIGGIGATNTVISGISTVGSLSIGSNEVISSARQLKNIASLDTTTQNTIEAAIATGPNTFDDLQVTGVSTFKADVIAEDNLLVSGIATFTGTPNLPGANVSGVSTFAALVDANAGVDVTGHSELDNVNVSGVSTFAGIGTFSSHLYVAGNLNVVGDVVYDEVTGRNINITGIGTIAQFNSTNSVLGVGTLSSATVTGDINANGNIIGDSATNITGVDNVTASTLNVTGLSTFGNTVDINAALDVSSGLNVSGHTELDNVNITGVGTVAQFNATNASIGVVTFTTATIGNLVGSPLSGVSTEFTGQIGIQSGGVRIGVGVTQLNFVGAGNTFQYNPSTDTVDITISGSGGGGGGGSVSIGQTAPVNPSSGDLWFNIDIARTFVYYNEAALGVGSSSFWVDASPFEASGMFLSKMGDNMLAGLGITAGTISAPGLYFNGDTNTGLYSPAADQFAFTAGGVGIATFQAGILEAGGARFSAGGVSAGVVTSTSLNVTGNIIESGGELRLKNASGDSNGLKLYQGGSDTSYILNHYSGPLVLGNINAEKLRIGTAGQIGIAGTGHYGTDGQVLTSKGTGAAPQWATPAAGWVKLGSGSATSGTTSVVTTNQLTTTYHFYKVLFSVVLSSNGEFGINLSTNGGTSYTPADGSWRASVQGRDGGSNSGIGEACNWGCLIAGNNKKWYAGEIDFVEPTGTVIRPTFNFRGQIGETVTGSSNYFGAIISTVAWDTTGAYDAIRLESNQAFTSLKWTFLGMAV